MLVVIVGARGRMADLEKDVKQVGRIMQVALTFPQPITFSSIGTDSGLGAFVRTRCIDNGYPFVELRCQFEGKQLEKSVQVEAYAARNLALAHLGTDFHFFVNETRYGLVEHLLLAVKKNAGRISLTGKARKQVCYNVYGVDGSILEWGPMAEQEANVATNLTE